MKAILAKARGKLFIFKCRMFKRNIHIAKGLKIYKRLSISGKGKVVIGSNCVIDGIRGDKSQYVTLDTHSPEAEIRIGNNAVLVGARMSAKYQITIGEDVLIEESGIVDTDFHSIHRNRGDARSEEKENCRIEIGNRVCVGARSVITKGVIIEDDVVIISGSVVNRSIKSGAVVCGNPAKVIGSREAI